MDKDEALKLAYEALEFDGFYGTQKQRAITAIKQALAAPVQPVSGVVLREGLPTLLQDKHIKETDQRLCILPTTPPAAQQPWVGLTDDEMYLNCPNWLSQEQCKVWVQQIEAKLKEKNT
jgi:hypothetical protein